ncbi:Myb/SANT-like domain-containing protein, partial [Chytridium lagenaria]
WTDKQSAFVLEAIVGQKQRGKGTDGGGLKAESWQNIMVNLNATFRVDYTVDQIKSHFNQMWKPRYNAIKALKDMSGFGWSEDMQNFTAPDECGRLY